MADRPDEMFCPACGERIRRSANFCRYCGEPNRKQGQSGWGPGPSRSDGPGGEGGSHETGRREREPQSAGGRDGGWERTRRGTPPESPGRRSGPHEPGDGPRRQPDAYGENGVPWRAFLPPQARRPDDSTLRVVGAAIGLGLLGFALLAVITVVISGVGFAAGLSLPAVLLVGTVVGQYIGFLGLSLWYLRYRGLDWDHIKGYLGIRRPTLREIGLIFAAWLVLIIGAIAISILAQFIAELLGAGQPGEAEQDITRILADNPEYVPGAIIIMFLVVGPCEEILFRGIVQGRLREHLSAAPAIGITSVFFAVLHVGGIGGSLEGILISISVLALSGAVLGSLYEYTQNLVVVSLLHGFHNSVIVLIVYANAVYNLEEAVITPLVVVLPV